MTKKKKLNQKNQDSNQKNQDSNQKNQDSNQKNNNQKNNNQNEINNEKLMDYSKFDIIFLGSAQFLPSQDDFPLLEALQEKNIRSKFFDWKDLETDLNSKESKLCKYQGLIIVRTPWDYTQNYIRMRSFLDCIKKCNIQIENPLSLLWATMNKEYLLSNSSFNFIPEENKIQTVFLKSQISLEEISTLITKNFSEFDQLIVKPLIGSFGNGVMSIKSSEISNKSFGSTVKGKHLRHILEKYDLILQPQFSSIKTHGETSLIFFDEEFSHAVCKVPCQNSITVQGGKITAVKPTTEQLKISKSIIQRITKFLNTNLEKNKSILYLRIDFVLTNNLKNFKIMEIESFDPELFFKFSNNNGIERMSQAIEKRLKKN